MNTIKYIIKKPKLYPSYIGEVTFDLKDLDDRSILSLSEEQLFEHITLPLPVSNTSANNIVNIAKLYPRHPISSEQLEEDQSTRSMRISIEYSHFVPDRIFFQQVSIRVLPYIVPPTRCYNCQRYGHGGLVQTCSPLC